MTLTIEATHNCGRMAVLIHRAIWLAAARPDCTINIIERGTNKETREGYANETNA